MPQLYQPTAHTTHNKLLLHAHGLNALLNLAIALKKKNISHRIGAIKKMKMIDCISVNQSINQSINLSINQSTKVIQLIIHNLALSPLLNPTYSDEIKLYDTIRYE